MNTQNRSLLQDWVRPVLAGLCVGVLCGTLLLLLMAVAIRSVDIPRGIVTPLAIAAAAVGAFAAGLTAALVAKQRGLLLGFLCGLLLFCILLLAGYARFSAVDSRLALIKLAVLAVTGSIGGVLGVNRRRR